MMTFLMDGKKDASDGSMEQVRPGTTSLATLVEPGDAAPIDFADWLTMIEPAMQDLSDSSYAWWEKVMTEATTWYQDYVKLRPLQRSMFEASPSSELRKTKWVRVERRAVTMMMSAVPASIKDELVATKSLSPLKIITKLMTIYQPGGLQEKSVILKQLEDPGEAAGTSAAVAQLRKWLRWMRRAEDVNLSLPDASILMRGLTRLMKKVLTLHPEFNFRASLVRNTLQLDTIPKHTTVRTYGEHLLAELEQMVHLEKKTKQSAVAATDLHEPPTMPEKPKVRAMDGNDYGGKGGGKYGGGKGSPKGGGSLEELKPCRFFLTDYGCKKKGGSCQWSHDLKDDKRRCFSIAGV